MPELKGESTVSDFDSLSERRVWDVEKGGWESLAAGPDKDGDLSQLGVEGPIMTYDEDQTDSYVPDRVFEHFDSDKEREEVIRMMGEAISYDSLAKTFTLFTFDGENFPSPKDPSFNDKMDNPMSWVPERRKFQNESIRRQIDDACRESESLRSEEREKGYKPTIYVFRGLSAAGKTSAIKRIPGVLIERDEDGDEYTVGALAPDVSKRDLRVAGGLTDQIHKESSSMYRRVKKGLRELIDSGEEISEINDRVMEEQGDIQDIVNNAVETGRRIELHDIDVPLEVSAMRLLLRPKGGKEPNPNYTYLENAFRQVRANRLDAIDRLRKAHDEFGTPVDYTLYCYDSESKPKKVQREAFRMRTDPETGELTEEVLDERLFALATGDTRGEIDVVSQCHITDEYLDGYCQTYFDDDEVSQRYEKEMRDAMQVYVAMDEPMTIYEALAEKNKN